MKNEKKRIALVNQRYGLEVNGGSEYYTRELAEHLKIKFNVEVLTTKALEYETWEDYYNCDIENINGVTVRRFHVSKPRNLWGMRIFGKIQKYFPFFKEFIGNLWLDAQGPYSPDLISYIDSHQEEYDLFIFVTYLYYHTAKGLIKVADKAVLLPTAHDEPYIHFEIFKSVFMAPKAIIYLTSEEKELVEALFPVKQKINCIAGAGVDLPKVIDNEVYRKKYRLKEEYIIYVGRIEPGKGCAEMFRYFRKYKNENPKSTLNLVLMGKAMMDIPVAEDILYQGFVSEEDKFNGISGAKALWLPSEFESLSIAVLEAMAVGVPVIVNGKCKVLKGHCDKSNAGLYYINEKEAIDSLKKILNEDKRSILSQNAKRYVNENYQWKTILDRVENMLNRIMG